MAGLVSVVDAARELGVHPSRVRSLIGDGSLRAEKVGGRWLVDWESVVARRRAPVVSGRPLAAHNAWALLLETSGEPLPDGIDAVARWRLRQALAHQGLVGLRGRLERRARVHRLWGLSGEVRALRGAAGVVLTGSSAAGAYGLELAAPDSLDAYVAEPRLAALIGEYGLQDAPAGQANVMLRAVPREAWLLEGRRAAPKAAVAMDLASYADARSARVGMQVLRALEREGKRAGGAS
jgi:excisionase family DNA binding protein